MALLNAAIPGSSRGPRGGAHYAVEVLDERLRPVFASAGDLTPYGVELLVEAVCRPGRAARLDLFVGAARAAALQVTASRQIDWLRARALAIHVQS